MQACADDPQVAVHAVRNLARLGMGVVEHNWMELGFGRTSTTTTAQATPRNLLGFKDGTRKLKAEEPAALDRYVWVGDGDDGAGWLVTGRDEGNVDVEGASLGEQWTAVGCADQGVDQVDHEGVGDGVLRFRMSRDRRSC